MKGKDKTATYQNAHASAAHTVGAKALQRKAVGVVQKAEPEEEIQQQKSDGTVQKMEAPELDEEHPSGVTQHKPQPTEVNVFPVQRRENKTGMPDNLKSGIENLSGMSMDHVKVHYNSSQPAQLNALAYAQGSDIHIAPGQEKHLPHEAWHVVQQAQGRVQATTQMKTGVPVNDDPGLEHEADVMGEKALSAGNGVSLSSGIYQNKSYPLVAQMVHPSHVKITGISHLVKMDSGSIFESEEELEVNHGQDIIIDLDREHISRRGPNQEVHRDNDEEGDAIYRWVKVLSVNGEELDDYFVREDAFVIVPLFEKIETDEAIKDTYENARNIKDIVALEDLSERLPQAPLEFELGKQVAKGGTSTLHEIENHPHLLVKKGGGRLSVEALGLIRMEMVGLPTVYVAQRQNCLVVTRLDIVGSKELLGRSRKPRKLQDIIDDEDSNYITEKTIEDLKYIWETLTKVPMNIGDFQFLINKEDGSVILNDPVSVKLDVQPAPKILELMKKVETIFKKKAKLKE